MALEEGSTEVETSGPSMSAEEEAFFSSGGNAEIPADASAAAGGEAGDGDGSAAKPSGTDKTDGKNDHVPLATFLEEKKSRKELATKFAEAEKKLAEFTGKFAIIDRLKLAGETDPAQPAAPPTPEEDIFGAVKHIGETVAQMQKRTEEQAEATKAAEKVAGEQKVFVDKYKGDAATFTATTPDYMDAYNFLLTSRAAELKAIGYDTPETLHQALVADEYAIAQMAFEKGKSPAQMLYDLANQRGYKKAAAKVDGSEGAAAEKLAAIERGQAAHKSLSNTGGSSGDQDMTAEALIAMPADEFESWCNKNPAKAKRLFGG